ncbi:MAG: hypothetical protein OYH77_00405 [Pseudomonadota bacterium]|nr:hypothetical protein [Pseudomonadota bacterium]
MKRFALVVCGLFLMAESAFAIVDFQAMYSLRMMKEGQEGEGSEARSRLAPIGAKIAVHTNPLPVVPVALGLTLMPISMWSEDTEATSPFNGLKESEMLEVGVELMAWLPMVPVVRPYMKLGFDFLGSKVEKPDAEGASETKLNYMTINSSLGLKYALPMLPMLGVIAEGNLGIKRIYSKHDTLQMRVDALNEELISYFGGSIGVEVAI